MIKDVFTEIKNCVPMLEEPCMQELLTDTVLEFFEYCEECFETDDPIEIIDKLIKTDWELIYEYLDDARSERLSKTSVLIFETCIDNALSVYGYETIKTGLGNLAACGFRNMAMDVIRVTADNILLKD